MEYIFSGLSFLIIPIIVSGVIALLRQPKKAEKGKVYLPKLFVILGLITSAVFLIPAIITAFSDKTIWLATVLFVLSLVGSCLIIAFVNCRVNYDDEGFVAKNFFGIKRKFTYDQVTAIKENMHEDYIYIGKRKVMIDEFAVGGVEFIAHVRKKYRTIHKGKELPIIRKTKHDIFNGNVDDVFEFMFAYITVSVIIVAFAIFLIKYIYFTPNTLDGMIEQRVSFTSFVEKEDEILLRSSDNKLYKIIYIDDEFNPAEIKSFCDGNTVLTTYSKEVTPDNGVSYYSIKAILLEDTYLLSLDETTRSNREEYWPLIFFPIIFAVVWGAYVAGSIIVGRNPKKYSKKVIKIFFKDGYVNY